MAQTATPFTKRSLFGFFCRRCHISFIKLNFQGIVKLHGDYLLWCAGCPIPESSTQALKGPLNTSDHILLKPMVDKQQWATADSFEDYERAAILGDASVAAENLRRFFEQRFHSGADSGYRQMALLNLGRMHYRRGEHGAALKFLQEGVTVARTVGDRLTLQHCTSILRRIPPENPQEKPILNEVQGELNPLEILFDVSKLMKPEYEQPLSMSFDKIFQSMGLYDNWVDVQLATGSDEEEWAQHAVQSVLWREVGCERLATVEENIVYTFTEHASDDQTRLIAILNRSYKKARDGDYKGGLADLLDPSVWQGLALDDYSPWAYEVWNILLLRASRRNEMRIVREYLLPKRPAGEFNARVYFVDTPPLSRSNTRSLIRDQLHRIIQMKQCDQVTLALKELLKAVWQAEFQGRYNLYRTAMVMLADVALELEMTHWPLKIMEELLPQLVRSDERELRAFGCFTYARCLLASSANARDKKRTEAIRYLHWAESDYRAMEIYDSQHYVLHVLSAVYEDQGRKADLKVIKERISKCEANQENAEKNMDFTEYSRVWRVVAHVGAALASR